MGQGRAIGKVITYAEVARFDGGLDSWEEDCEGEMGGGCKGVFEEERVCAGGLVILEA